MNKLNTYRAITLANKLHSKYGHDLAAKMEHEAIDLILDIVDMLREGCTHGTCDKTISSHSIGDSPST